MKTVALRFGEHFSPECGTIAAHEEVIGQYGYVWYGKMGSKISEKMMREIMASDNPKILLIRSGKAERYWAYIEAIQYAVPNKETIPEYYRDTAGIFKTWFKVKSFKKGAFNIFLIITKCPEDDTGIGSVNPWIIPKTIYIIIIFLHILIYCFIFFI